MDMKHIILKAVTVLGGAAVLGGALVATTHLATRAQIAHNERETLLQTLNEVMPPALHDNALYEDVYQAVQPTLLGTPEPQTIYRARLNGEPSGAVITTVAPNGYNGRIKLLVGVDINGTILGVRVLAHQETPGLGDAIERKRSDWITDFNGHALGNPSQTGWAVRRDGGMFDQFTGATITPRAVVTAVYQALQFYQQHHVRIFQQPSTGEPPTPADFTSQ